MLTSLPIPIPPPEARQGILGGANLPQTQGEKTFSPFHPRPSETPARQGTAPPGKKFFENYLH